MKRLPRRLDRFNLVLFSYATAALLAAAVLMIYLQHQALTAQNKQTSVILKTISEKTAAAIDAEMRRVFDGPVIETVTAINHPDIQRERLDLVAEQFARATRDYPHVARFFVWTNGTQSVAPNEVLFYGQPRPDSRQSTSGTQALAHRTTAALGRQDFHRDTKWGRLIYRVAQEGSVTQQVYVTEERTMGDARYDIIVRLYWVDATRDRVLAALGFVTDLSDVRSRLFPELHRRHFARLLDPGGGLPRLEMQILDDAGQRVFSTGESIASLTPRRTIDMRFFPASGIRTRLASEIPRRDWTLLVGPAVGSGAAVLSFPELRGYSLAAVSVLLMLTGLFFAVQGYRRERQLARTQADFIAHASHQLKTPLTLMSAVCETLTLERARSPERQAKYLEIMRVGTARLTELVERILEFSRVDEGQRRYEMEPVDVGPLVRETVDAFKGGFSDEDVRIAIEEDGASLVVVADPVALEQAVVNLLDNAVKYSERIKNITVRVFRSASDAIIEVSDEGIGIAESDHARVFEKFYRASGASIDRQGFGLGLAIVRELVSAHHGSIELDSRPGHGSTFRMRIPLARGNKAQQMVRATDGWDRSWLARVASDGWRRMVGRRVEGS